jgi:probable F420-dependent oxidoreductase
MSPTHPFRFGVQASGPASAGEWAELARKVEDLGYSTLTCADHLDEQFAPIPALTAAALATSTLRVGAMVLANDYRHPVLAAKEAATVDVLSEGRFEVGLGAGWMTTDYEQSGIPHDRAGVRVDRMVEAIAVMKGLFAEGPFSFQGEHYTITDHDARPKPVTQPHPPFLIGGGGKRVLGIAAREADIVGINPNLKAGEIGPDAASDATAEATDRKVGWVREAAGDRFDDLELNSLMFACIRTDDRAGTAEMMAGLFGISPAEVLEVPHALMGTVDEMVDDLEARRDRWGFSYHVVQQDAMDAIAPVVARLAGT